MIDSLLASGARFLPVLATLGLVLAVLLFFNWFLRRRWQDDPDAQFRFQLIMLALTLASFVLIIIVLPIEDTLRGQLLSLLGILLSAAIALSSTTFIGNVMAGIMLKAVRKARPGDFITVADLTGRITEMDLLQTEVQTEFRDLVTVPNLYMVTQPLKVVRASGTILTAEVSLGYDVPRTRVAAVLKDAATAAGLSDCFVHIRNLGDYSVSYRVAGLLEDVKSLISARSKLWECMLDALHEADIEIVSPAFTNMRSVAPDKPVIPPANAHPHAGDGYRAEEIAFDKAEDAASVEDLKTLAAGLEAELEAQGGADDESQRRLLEQRLERLRERLKRAEKLLRGGDAADADQS